MQKGTEWVSSIMSSALQFELERTGAPFACVTVEHGALCEGNVPFGVYQDYCIGPEKAGEQGGYKQNKHKKIKKLITENA